jgi:membrane-bound lytic murein transglycosylase B
MKYFILLLTLFSLETSANYLSHPDAAALIEELVQEHNFEREFVEKVLLNANKQQKIIESISSPAEFTLTWDRYKNIFIEEKRIANGKKFIQDNLETFKRVEEEYGVPKEVITAIIGVETRYGKIQGSYRVIDSLLTLGFDYPRRAKFFRSELVKFFLLTRENELNIEEVKGSYAGAMGFGQFISSSYRAYAIDYDGDGYADLFNSVDDAIGSVANYLYVHGWKRDGEIVTVTYPNNVRKIFKPNSSVSKFIPLSFTEGDNELFFIGDDNFIAITKYNISHFYAMAVYYLSEELKK